MDRPRALQFVAVASVALIVSRMTAADDSDRARLLAEQTQLLQQSGIETTPAGLIKFLQSLPPDPDRLAKIPGSLANWGRQVRCARTRQPTVANARGNRPARVDRRAQIQGPRSRLARQTHLERNSTRGKPPRNNARASPRRCYCSANSRRPRRAKPCWRSCRCATTKASPTPLAQHSGSPLILHTPSCCAGP